ncbi:hypothetical protein C0991_005771 [Blastosporella zonata]|nr:hypothetical protein C0991_005771 [Blastosporella zonata]
MDIPTLFASNLRTFSNNTVTDLQYAGLTRDEALSHEALQVAAGLFKMWDQRPERLQDEDWVEETAVMEAGQELWTMWSLKEWAQEMPYYKFFSVAMVPGRQSVALADVNMTDTMEMPLFEENNKDFETSPVQKPYATSEGVGKRKAGVTLGGVSMDSGPSNARPTKVPKTGSGQPSTKQVKALVDISDAHPTEKDSVNEGLEGDIAVQVRWSTRAIVRLAPHNERVEFREAEGPNLAGDTACNAQRWARAVKRKGKKAAAPAGRVACTLDDNKEGPAAGPSNTTPMALPTLGTEDNEEEVLGVVSAEGILREPKLETRDDGAPVAPEGAEGDGESESAKLVWRPADKPATKFKRVTQRVGEMREMETAMADYAAACKRECADLRFKLLGMHTVLGETRRLQGTLVEARREAEEALWEILAFK